MATQYPSNRSYRDSGDYSRSAASAEPGISRSRSGYGSAQRSGGYGSRPSGQRYAGSPRGYDQRPYSGPGRSSAPNRGAAPGRGSAPSRRPAPNRGAAPNRGSAPSRRPPSSGGRRPPQRRQPQGRFFAFLAIAVVLIVAVILIVAKPGSRPDRPVATQVIASNPTPTPASVAVDVADPSDTSGTGTGTTSQYANIAEMLSKEDSDVQGLSADQMVQVEGLSINQSLPSEWLNVLLLGTDERVLSDSARTDTMIICSINRNTGEVKLTSIMRDLQVAFNDIGKYNGTYGINAANFFGGPKLAVKTVNELFDMNIQYCVMVNFFGFGKIAQRLGGIEVNVSEAEMKIINDDIVQQFKAAYYAGIKDFDPEQVYLETYGENTHLNGNQTLAYARIRHLDGGDYMRTTRQQTVMAKLLEKVKKLNALEITTLAAEMIDQVKTNMPLDDIITLAILVAGNGISNVETFRLPVQGTYKEERRNDKSGLWDCDFSANAIKLYDFIYE